MRALCHAAEQMVFPARAGMNRDAMTASSFMDGVPRPRGDEPFAQPGLILQNPAPTCASYSPTATKHFGPTHRWKIIYAKGAKGLESFGSGHYPSEKEVTMLPNHRFMIIKHEPKTRDGFAQTTVLLLPPDPALDSDYWS